VSDIEDIKELHQRITSLGAPRNQAEARLINEAQRQLTLATAHTKAIADGMSLAARAVYEVFASEAERTAAALLYAVRVLRGVE
jgi:hypothetical protein